MANHTPGPWTANFTILNGVPIDFHIAAKEHGSSFPVAQCGSIKRVNPASEIRANAYLIAAAPEMLEALYRVESLLGRPHDEDGILELYKDDLLPIYSKLLIAINKAEGRSNG